MRLSAKVIGGQLVRSWLPYSVKQVAELIDTSKLTSAELGMRLELFKPFIAHFGQNLGICLGLEDYDSLGNKDASNRLEEYYLDFAKKLADPAQSLPAIVSWLLGQKADDATYFFPPPATSDNNTIKQSFEALTILSKIGCNDTDVFVVIEEYATQYLEYSASTLYQITNNNRLAALRYLERIGIHCAETVSAVRQVLAVCHDDILNKACHKALSASKLQLRDIIFNKIMRTPLGSNEEQELADCYDQYCGAIDQHKALALLTRVAGHEPITQLSRLFNILDGQVQLGRLLRSSLRKNDHWLKPEKFEEQLNALERLKIYLHDNCQGGFEALLEVWGLDTVINLSLRENQAEFNLAMAQAAILAIPEPQSNSLNIVSSPTARCVTEFANSHWQSNDLRQQIRLLADFLSEANCRFDHEVFRSILAIIAQCATQTIAIDQTVITAEEGKTATAIDSFLEQPVLASVHPPHFFYPLIEVLVAKAKFHRFSFPQDAFLEIEVSCLLNTFFPNVSHPDHGYQIWQLLTLLELIPMALNADRQNRKAMRDNIQDLDDNSSNEHPLYAFMRKRIHSNPSPADWTFCSALLKALQHPEPVNAILTEIGHLLSEFPVELASLKKYLPERSAELIELQTVLQHVSSRYPKVSLEELVEQESFITELTESSTSSEAVQTVTKLLALGNSLHKRWCRRLAERDILPLLADRDQASWPTADSSSRLGIIKANRDRLREELATATTTIKVKKELFRRQHIAGRIGLIATYEEAKLTAYQAERTLAIVQRDLLEDQLTQLLNMMNQPVLESSLDESLVNSSVECLVELLDYLRREGLAFSQSFLDMKEMLEKDSLSLKKLKDLFVSLQYKEPRHFHAFLIYKLKRYMASVFKLGAPTDFQQSYQRPEIIPANRYIPWAVEKALSKIHDGPDQHIKQLSAYLTAFTKYIAQHTAANIKFRTSPRQARAAGELSPATAGSKGFNLWRLLDKLKGLIKIPAFEILTVDLILNDPALLTPRGRDKLAEIVIERILRIEESSQKIFDFADCRLSMQQESSIKNRRLKYDWVKNMSDINDAPKLSLSLRGGAYPSMPGILGTILHAGRKPLRRFDLVGLSEIAQRSMLEAERVFLSTYGSVALGITQTEFSEIIVQKKRDVLHRKQPEISNVFNPFTVWNVLYFWSSGTTTKPDAVTEPSANELPSIAELSIDDLWAIVEEHRSLISKKGSRAISNNPLDNVLDGIIAIWRSWDSSIACKMCEALGIADDWRSAIVLQDMREPQGNAKSFSAILFTGDPQDPLRAPFGNISFGKVGEDLASGLSNNSVDLDSIAVTAPALYKRICEILELVRDLSGQVHMDIELVGEYSEAAGEWDVELNWDLFLLQLRQAPVVAQPPSAKFDVNPAALESAKMLTKGEGMLGGAQHFVLVNAIGKSIKEIEDQVKQLRTTMGPKDQQNSPGIYILLEYATSEESPKIIHKLVDGVITTTDQCSHGSVAAWGHSKAYIARTGFAKNEETKEWYWGTSQEKVVFVDPDTTDPQFYTVIGHPPHIAGALSGAIFAGRFPLVEREIDY